MKYVELKDLEEFFNSHIASYRDLEVKYIDEPSMGRVLRSGRVAIEYLQKNLRERLYLIQETNIQDESE